MDLSKATRQELYNMPYEYVKEAYHQHNPNSVGLLGLFFLEARNGAPQDYEKARQFLEVAFEHGDKEVGIFLVSIYSKGLGTEFNPQKATEYYTAYAEKTNNPNGYSAIALMYLMHEELPQRDEKFEEYVLKSDALGGCYGSDLFMGDFYLTGYAGNNITLPQDINKAIFHYKRGRCYKQLGDLYSNGKYLEENYKLANYYYTLGMDNDLDCLCQVAIINLAADCKNEPWVNEEKGFSAAVKYIQTNDNCVQTVVILRLIISHFIKDNLNNITTLETCLDYLYLFGKCPSDENTNAFYILIDTLSDLYLTNNYINKISILLDKLIETEKSYPQITNDVNYLAGLVYYKYGMYLLNTKDISASYDCFVWANKLGYDEAKKYLNRFKKSIFGKWTFK